jgi:2-hydroxychromene-2-carboxylate isomerase
MAVDRAGLDSATLVEQASSPENKARLRVQTEQAITAGVFGIPTVEADGELFWGHDSLPHVELFLQDKDPLDPGTLARWANLPASASRL